MENAVREGDILVFKPENHWLSKAIALLTNSDVSHAAMVYRRGTLVEMELNGIQLTPFTPQEGDGVYLMRLNSEPDAEPLLNAAQAYLCEETRYDLPGLVLLAGLLMYRWMRPTPSLVEITDLILRGAIVALDQLIQKIILKNPHKAMVCSQLVYQIYNDCDKNYHILLTDGIFQAGDEDNLTHQGRVRLIDQIDNTYTFDGGGWERTASYNRSETASPELLARSLCRALTKQNESRAMAEDGILAVQSLVGPGRKLLEQLEQLLKLCKQDMPIAALFVTPADFVYHAQNLRLIRTLDIIKG